VVQLTHGNILPKKKGNKKSKKLDLKKKYQQQHGEEL
jgi:hypothetical protein